MDLIDTFFNLRVLRDTFPLLLEGLGVTVLLGAASIVLGFFGGLGVAFFAPFCAERYFFPWHEIEVSPLTIHQFFSQWGGAVVRSEFKFICVVHNLLKWVSRKLASAVGAAQIAPHALAE